MAVSVREMLPNATSLHDGMKPLHPRDVRRRCRFRVRLR